MREALLPSYATVMENGSIAVDADKFYPAYLKELWAEDNWPTKQDLESDPSLALYENLQRGEIDQYWLEVAYTCMKLDIQRAVAGTKLAPKGGASHTVVVDASKAANDDNVSTWALAKYKEGRGVFAASKGREAMLHYKRIR